MKPKKELKKKKWHNTSEILKELKKKIKPKICAVMETNNGISVQCDGELTDNEKEIVKEVIKKWQHGQSAKKYMI